MNKESGAGASPDGTRVGADLVDAFEELAAYLRGEVEAESYVVDPERLSPEPALATRRKAVGPAEKL